MVNRQSRTSWVEQLGDEDLAFVKRFVLASGSLKALAKVYGVSYPTIRLRLDRLIAKVELTEAAEKLDEFERMAREMHIDGRIDADGLRALLGAHRKEMERSDEANPDNQS